MEKMNFFISQPMRDKTDVEIAVDRIKAIQEINEKFGEGHEILPNYKKELKEVNPVYALGSTIQILSNADICVFVKGWNKSRGCQIEHKICEEYHITIWEI